jgi:hypothetical protein
VTYHVGDSDCKYTGDVRMIIGVVRWFSASESNRRTRGAAAIKAGRATWQYPKADLSQELPSASKRLHVVVRHKRVCIPPHPPTHPAPLGPLRLTIPLSVDPCCPLCQFLSESGQCIMLILLQSQQSILKFKVFDLNYLPSSFPLKYRRLHVLPCSFLLLPSQ